MKFSIKNILILIRPHQYVKNLFIFAPLFFVGKITDIDLIIRSLIAFVAFSGTASAIYIFNDICDIEEDRKHPKKQFRPLASGVIPKNFALSLIGILFVFGLLLIGMVSIYATTITGVYIILNISYSVRLKHFALLDVTIIAIGFVLRLFIGSAVTGIQLSKWIVIMTFLLALFLALAKRRDDVLQFNTTGKKLRKALDGYNLKLIDATMMIMASVVIVTYILYATSIEVVQKMESEYLYLTALFVVLGIMRYLQISFVENESDSPTKIFLKDIFLQITIIAWILSFVLMIYF